MLYKTYEIGHCALCKKYGRLEICKNLHNNQYFIKCNECLTQWKHPNDALNNFDEYRDCMEDTAIRSATPDEIKEIGWDKFIVK